MSVNTTLTSMRTAQMVRAKYPPRWRWLAPYFDEGCKAMQANRKRAAELLEPIYEKRIAETADGEKPVDSIQWLFKAARGKRKTLDRLAQEQLFLGITSIHSTSASVLSTIYDLLDRPHYIDEILEEIRTVKATLDRGEWTARSLDRLEKLDSFMKESQRYNPAGLGQIPPNYRAKLKRDWVADEICSHGTTLRCQAVHLPRRPPHSSKYAVLLPQL